MKNKILLFGFLFGLIHSAKAQTLFTYGTHAVSKDEFLQAYHKNPDTTGNKDEKLKEYLNLYINFRLKIQAAYDEKADKDANLQTEAENFKKQLTENYINKQAGLANLIHEAFVRSQKDILVQQIFVSTSGGNDTVKAYALILKAYNELRAGKKFEEIPATYSNDSSLKLVKGSIGYITVFTLPYSIENIIYNLKQGDISSIYRNNSGYYIFKNAEERPALGKRRVQQLLFPAPSFFTTQQINDVAHTADSVYQLLQKGTLFSSMLPFYSQNNMNTDDSGAIEVRVGEYSPEFEKEVFSLKNAGDISKPFKTGYGYNIIRLVENVPVSKDESDIATSTWLQTQIQNGGRLDTIKKHLVETWLKATGFKESIYNHNDLWIYTDSALKNITNLPSLYKGFKPETILFQFTKEKITVKDWIGYMSNMELPENENKPDYEKQMHDYIYISCNSYFGEHIEDFDRDATEQLKEFKDANLMFYVMDKHVWSKASNDSTGLKNYYATHSKDYLWKESVSAIIISAPDKAIADLIAVKLKENPESWRSLAESYNKVYADSNRFEIDELPVKQQIQPQKGFETSPEPNEDNYTFIYVMETYPKNEQKSFEEAKGLVINDYQQQLEEKWIAGLKKTYPVKINEAVLNKLH